MAEQIQMIVTTAHHVIEGVWEDTGSLDGQQLAAEGLAKTLRDRGDSIGLFTDDGVVVIPHHAVDHVRIRTRAVPS